MLRIEVGTGDDGAHAGQRVGGGDVVAADARMRVRALHQRAVEHTGAMQVGDVERAASDLLVAFELGERLADGACERGHRAPPSACAADRTAAMILT